MALKQPAEGEIITGARGSHQLVVRHLGGRPVAHLSVCPGGHFRLSHSRRLLWPQARRIWLRSIGGSLFHPNFGRLTAVSSLIRFSSFGRLVAAGSASHTKAEKGSYRLQKFSPKNSARLAFLSLNRLQRSTIVI
jgi:hypothetical protein